MKKHASRSATLLASALLTPAAFGQVSPFVDHYKTNVAANTTASTNAVVNLLSSYNDLWTTGTSWDNGAPTVLGAPVLRANMEYTRDITVARTSAQELSAYITDRQHQSYTAANGFGSLAADYRTGAASTTTVTTFGQTESGNGAGSTTSALGKVVSLVNTVRGPFSSTNPPKAAFNYPRPYRMNLDSQVIVLGTEAPGGTPANFPIYDSPVIVAPSLLGRRSTTPASDGGFPSGHTNAAYLASYAYAYALPERMAELMLNASQMGQDRIVAGMHSPLDVIGGRIEATALAAAILHDPANATLKADARAQAQTYFATQLAADAPVSQATWEAGKTTFTNRMTYGLPVARATGVAATVPQGAEVLLETRFTYLDAAQRREVLRTTALESGHAVQDAEGWSRLNLYAASGSYGRFDSAVSVTFSGGKDYWRNNISGTGGFTKLGTGTLVFTGDNTYTGPTLVSAGTFAVDGRLDSAVTVASGATLGGSGHFDGGVVLQAGATLAPGSSPGTMTFNDGLTIAVGTIMDFELGTVSDQVIVAGGALVGPVGAGGITLNIDDAAGFGVGTYTLFDFASATSVSDFDATDFLLGSTVAGYTYQVSQVGSTVQITVGAIPEPSSFAALAGLATLGLAATRRRRAV